MVVIVYCGVIIAMWFLCLYVVLFLLVGVGGGHLAYGPSVDQRIVGLVSCVLG